MSAPVQKTYLGRLHSTLCQVLLEALRGEPLVDKSGIPVMGLNGEQIYLPPTPAMLKEVREFLKDNNIDAEPIDGTPIAQVSQRARQYDDDCEPQLLTKE